MSEPPERKDSFYDADNHGFLTTIFAWNGTIVKEVLTSGAFWFFLMLHISLLVFHETSPWLWDSLGLDLDWKSTGAITSLLTFFIVFYGTQCYSRYMMFYGHCVGLIGLCQEWSALAKVYLPDDATARWNAARFIPASMHILFYSLNQSEGGDAITEQEWGRIRFRHLLTPHECSLITAYKGFKPFLPVMWALQEVEVIFASTLATGSVPRAARSVDALSAFRGLAFQFRTHCGQITNWLRNPVPFPYFSFLHLLLAVDLVLVSLGLVTLNFGWNLTVLSYVSVLAAFLGLKAVAIKMSDPFGDDEIDFDIEGMLASAYANSVALLQDERQALGSERAPLGSLHNPTAVMSKPSTPRLVTELPSRASTSPANSDVGRLENLASRYGDDGKVGSLMRPKGFGAGSPLL